MQALVFDFFGVICSEIAPAWLERHLPAAMAIDIKARIVGAADRGQIDTAQMFAELSKVTGAPADRIEREWHASAEIDPHMVDLVRRLARTNKLGLLTNAPAGFFRPIFSRTGLDAEFASVIISSELRCAKPEPMIFRIAAETLNVEIGQALLIDDNPINVEAARLAGMQAFLFTERHDLEAYLAAQAL